MQNLIATLVQCELAWESPAQNCEQLESHIANERDNTDIVVLPEMFNTGFSMNAEANAEPPGGKTEQWLRRMATELNCAVTGSIAIRDGDRVFNRMLFATPHAVTRYDKRHLFRMAGEDRHYAPGKHRVCVAWRGWRILLQVCYDLRFPVFSRNRGDYDLALYVANWPVARSDHWRCLLQARAIENLACVIGVNRVGEDGNGLRYVGDSLALDAHGNYLADLKDRPQTFRVTLDADLLAAHRARFPFHLDADNFALTAD